MSKQSVVHRFSVMQKDGSLKDIYASYYNYHEGLISFYLLNYYKDEEIRTFVDGFHVNQINHIARQNEYTQEQILKELD